MTPTSKQNAFTGLLDPLTWQYLHYIMSKRVERTHNGGTWTQSQYESAIRSALRAKFRFWKPSMEAKKRHSRPYKGKDKRRKIEVQCQGCMRWFPPARIQMDHIIPCGSLKNKQGKMTGASLLAFIKRLTPEDPAAFQPLCKDCHKKLTNKENAARREAKKRRDQGG